MSITFEHAKRLVLTSAEIMVREPEKHGYNGGACVAPVEIKNGRLCFCLMGGAAALLVAERGEEYAVKYTGRAFVTAWNDIRAAFGNTPLFWNLVDIHDRTEDVNEMYAKVKEKLK